MTVKEFIKNNKKKVGAAVMAALLLAGGATYAYFTDSNVLTNTFKIGNVDSTLVEEAWDAADPSEHENLAPNAVLAKDPKVQNNGTLDMYTFLQVTVPKADVKIASSDGKTVTPGVQELFSYTVNSGWTQVNKTETEDANVYVYAWASKDAMTAVAPEAETGTLFDTIKLANIIEGQGLENTSIDVEVKDFSIQTTDLTDDDTVVPADVWAIVSGQQAAK